MNWTTLLGEQGIVVGDEPHSANPGNARQVSTQGLVARARRKFERGEAIDFERLGMECNISRSTLYRRIRGLDELIGLIVASIFDDLWARLEREPGRSGAARVMHCIEQGMRYIAGFTPLLDFLQQDPHRGLWIVASRHGPVQGRTIAFHQRLMNQEIAAGRLRLSIDSRTMAYVVTRLAESFVYSKVLADREADVDGAMAIIGLLFRPPAAPRKTADDRLLRKLVASKHGRDRDRARLPGR